MVTYLVTCEVPGEGTYVQAVYSSIQDARREMKRLAGYASNYSIVEYNPGDYIND